MWVCAAQRHRYAGTAPLVPSFDQNNSEIADCYFIHTLLKFAMETYSIAQSPGLLSLSDVSQSFTPLQG